MTERDSRVPGAPSNADPVQPRWEQVNRRRELDRRMGVVRRSLSAGGLAGTVAFTALAGYESMTTTGADAPSPTATTRAQDQAQTASDFFDDQGDFVLDPPAVPSGRSNGSAAQGTLEPSPTVVPDAETSATPNPPT